MAIPLIETGGVPAVTLKAVGDRAGVTPSGVLRWFDSSALMWRRILTCFGNRWCAWLDTPSRPDPERRPGEPARLHAMLPLTPREVSWTRVWLALVEAGRCRPDLGSQVARVERHERMLVARGLAHALGSTPDDPSVDLTLALVRGLRHAVCAPEDPMSWERAQVLLDALLERLARSLKVE